MSQINANTILPLISALPDSEKRVLAEKLQAMIQEPEKRDSTQAPKGYENIPPKFWPGNQELLIYDIIHGGKS